jgi:hypothetical protein
MTDILGTCFTNLDDFQCYEWPQRFVSLPRVGDMVEGIGQGVVTRPTLRVIRITHTIRKGSPFILVELHR